MTREGGPVSNKNMLVDIHQGEGYANFESVISHVVFQIGNSVTLFLQLALEQKQYFFN